MKIDRARLFDKRVVQRNIRAGRVTKDEYQAWLADQSDTTEKIMARDEGGDDDGYEVPIKAPVSIAAVPPPGLASAAGASAPAVAHASAVAPADDDDEDDDDEDDEETPSADSDQAG